MNKRKVNKPEFDYTFLMEFIEIVDKYPKNSNLMKYYKEKYK